LANFEKVIKEMTGGGVDYSFECVGLPSLLTEAFSSTRTVHLYIYSIFLVVELFKFPIC